MPDFDFRLYQRHFRSPLTTSHGTWKVREGILLRLRDGRGGVGWGEIAPLPEFGSETLPAALAFCQSLTGELTEERIQAIPPALPACQFAFESAWEDLYFPQRQEWVTEAANFSYLLPTGEKALEKSSIGSQKRAKTFKWKIGLNSPEVEMGIWERLVQRLPAGSKVRLDANGGLTLAQAERWLALADRTGWVEFLEQPLAPPAFEQMLALSQQFQTPIALDESVGTLVQLEDCYGRGWEGIFIIKPAIAGSPRRLRQFCRYHCLDAVFSSVFETAIGRKAALSLAGELSAGDRALGFGIDHWFLEGEKGFWLETPWQDC